MLHFRRKFSSGITSIKLLNILWIFTFISFLLFDLYPQCLLVSIQLWSSLEISPLWPCIHPCLDFIPINVYSTMKFRVLTILLFSSSDIFSSMIMSFLLHFVYLTLLLLLISTLLFLYFYASKQLLHHTFLSCSPETNSCPQFSFVFVPLYLHLLHVMTWQND